MSRAKQGGIAAGKDIAESSVLSGHENTVSDSSDDRQQSVSVSMGAGMREEYGILLTEIAELRKALAEVSQLRAALIGNRDYGLVGVTGRLGQLCDEQESMRRWLIWLTVIVTLFVFLELAQWLYIFGFFA